MYRYLHKLLSQRIDYKIEGSQNQYLALNQVNLEALFLLTQRKSSIKLDCQEYLYIKDNQIYQLKEKVNCFQAK